MKERPMLFSGEMVRAILDGRKTQTRRVIKPQPKFVDDTGGKSIGGKYWDFGWCYYWPDSTYVHCWDNDGIGCGDWTGNEYPNENVLTRALQVSQKSKKCPHGKIGDRLWVRETFQYVDNYREKEIKYAATDQMDWEPQTWKPSIHMPRWASRIDPEITNVRVERLKDISEEDALAEGVERNNDDGVTYYGPLNAGHADPRVAFKWLWDSIAKDQFKWASNPWVWVIEFKVVEK